MQNASFVVVGLRRNIIAKSIKKKKQTVEAGRDKACVELRIQNTAYTPSREAEACLVYTASSLPVRAT